MSDILLFYMAVPGSNDGWRFTPPLVPRYLFRKVHVYLVMVTWFLKTPATKLNPTIDVVSHVTSPG
jgi:hypothetical protein